MNSELFFFYFLISFIVIIVVPTLLYNRHTIKSYKEPLYLTLFGIFFCTISFIIVVFSLDRWDTQFIIDFIFLKRKIYKKIWFEEWLTSFGYVFLIYGLTTFIIGWLDKHKLIPEKFISKAARAAECRSQEEKIFVEGTAIRLGKISKVITNRYGITFCALFKETFVPWEEVRGVKIDKLPYADTAKIITRKGNFPLSISMKEKYEDYPICHAGFLRYEWVYEDGSKKPLTIENCPLYQEIQKHLQHRPQ